MIALRGHVQTANHANESELPESTPGAENPPRARTKTMSLLM
jgi:hypothetical protein